mgnify:CR=1 FL=1
MADTVRGDFAKEKCSDCGREGCIAKHWGPLVPKGESGTFCGWCLTERNKEAKDGNDPKPLGWKMKDARGKAALNSVNLNNVIESRL